jgi:hypothetical protein
MTEADAANLLRLVREGSPLRSILDKAGSGFTTWHYRKYCRANPAFHAEVLAASKANEIAKKCANGQRRFANKTHCPKGHEYSGENVGMKLSRGRPSRFCRVCSRLAAATVRPMSAEQVEKVKALVNKGVTVHEIAHGGELHVTGHRNIKHQRSIDPAFDRLMARGKDIRRKRKDDEAYRKIRAMVPANLPAAIRDDIVQDIMHALFEKLITRDQVRGRISKFITEQFKKFPTKFAKFGNARLVSLDEVLFDDGNTTRGDTISEGLWAA